MVTHTVPRNWRISEDLFRELNLNPEWKSSVGHAVQKAEVVECPDDFVKANMEVKVTKDDRGFAKQFQPINIRNPVSGMSISGDEGKTWVALTQIEGRAHFMSQARLRENLNNIYLRIEGWMGGSNVLVKSGSGSKWIADVASGRGNNACRGKDFYSEYKLQIKMLARSLHKAHWNGLVRVERMFGILRRNQVSIQSCDRWRRLFLFRQRRHRGRDLQHGSLFSDRELPQNNGTTNLRAHGLVRLERMHGNLRARNSPQAEKSGFEWKRQLCREDSGCSCLWS